MTEEIIIDDVDVAGCEHYCEKLNTGSGFIQNTSKQGFCLHNITGLQNADIYFRVLSFPKCREQSNCYFKQLKRLEQENKVLKDNNNHLQAIIDDGRAENKRFREENKELKEINTALIQEAEDVAEARIEICNQCGNRDDYNIPCKMIRDLDYGLNITIEERDTYRSALEEIRDYLYTLTTVDSDFVNTETYLRINDKINEVLNEQ